MWADQRRGVEDLCIKIGFSEPNRAEKGPPPEPRALGWRNTRFWLADDSGDVMLDFDWLPRTEGFSGGRFWSADDSGNVILNSDWLTTQTESVEPKADSMY